jgi:hypothetical protein
VNQLLFVKKAKRIQDGTQHIARFVGAQRALWQELGEILLGELHHHVEQILAVLLTLPHFQNGLQVGMGKTGSRPPTLHLSFCL